MQTIFKKYFVKIVPVILLLAFLILPAVALASWWNPFSWNIWQKITSIFQKPQVVQVQQEKKADENILLNNVYIFEGKYQFEEFAMPNQGWLYDLYVFSNGGRWRITLNVDGFKHF